MGPGLHSPVGASSIKRALLCPASVSLGANADDEESEHAKLGTAVHAIVEKCFSLHKDAWEMVGSVIEGLNVTPPMAEAAQVMLHAVRERHTDRNQGNFWVERKFHCPEIHPMFFGTSDVVYLDESENAVHIWDYKNGAGVIVEVVNNEQLKYYACGALQELNLWSRFHRIVLHIVQPNGFHSDGPVREWCTTSGELFKWLHETLVPGMTVAMSPGPKTIASGDHCRFCPVRFKACPQLVEDMEELGDIMKTIETEGGAAELNAEQLGRFLALYETAKIVGKAVNKTAFNRLQAGSLVEGWKLVKGKANRVWKDGVDAEARAAFGEQAFTKPALKSPAQIEELPKGGAFCARWSSKPEAGLTLAPASSARAEVSRDTKSLFTDVTKRSNKTAQAGDTKPGS
jgi:hypothetical protein